MTNEIKRLPKQVFARLKEMFPLGSGFRIKRPFVLRTNDGKVYGASIYHCGQVFAVPMFNFKNEF